LVLVHSLLKKAKKFRPPAKFPARGYQQHPAAPSRALALRRKSRQVQVEPIWDELVWDEEFRTAAPPNHP
jgi:hypothetical protein